MATVAEEIQCLKDQVAALVQRDLELQEQTNKVDFETGVFGFVADAGLVGTVQTNVAAMMQDWGADAYLFGGDNNYEDGEAATIEANWAEFDFAVSAFNAFPALGNHDLDNTGLGETPGSPQTDKFNYLPGNKRYYHKFFAKGSVDLFVINSGVDSSGTLVEPDGNAVGSNQHAWFVRELEASVGRYKVVMFHHPHVTNYDEDSQPEKHLNEMDWPEFADVDLILCGHTHIAEVLQKGGVPIINTSTGAKAGRRYSTGVGARGYKLFGADADAMLLGRDAYNIPTGEKLNDREGDLSATAIATKLFFTPEGIVAELWLAPDPGDPIAISTYKF